MYGTLSPVIYKERTMRCGKCKGTVFTISTRRNSRTGYTWYDTACANPDCTGGRKSLRQQ